MADEVFVGRRDEQARFATLLQRLTAAGGPVSRRWLSRRAPSRNDGAEGTGSHVVLVYGLGGTGKSLLLKQFEATARGGTPGSSGPAGPAGEVRAAWLDWQDEVEKDPPLYAGQVGPSLLTVLDAVRQAVTEALAGDRRARERVLRAFGDYQDGAKRMPEYAARFRDVVVPAGRPGSPFTSQDASALVRAAVSAGLVTAGHPGGVLGLGPGQLAATAQAGGHLTEAALRAVTGRRSGEISAQEYELVTDPARELTRRFAAAVRTAAGPQALVVFLDTGEVIGDRAWRWLRRLMCLTGPQVAWVVGARFETEAEAGADSQVARFIREIGNEHLILMSPPRFDDATIRAYLESRPGARPFSAGQIDLIARFTRGLPLAVSLTATLLDAGQPVEQACRDIDDGHASSVIARLARRYLEHAEAGEAPDAHGADDPRRGDIAKILALALAYGNLSHEPDLLAALWETSDPLATFQDLARRHDFVLPVSRRLHDDVRDVLRIDLLDPYRRRHARRVNKRALAFFTTRLARLRARWPTVDEQLVHAEFTTALLGALWHTLWISNQDGLDLLTAILPVLAAADARTADAAAALAGQFDGTWTSDQEHTLDQFTTQHRPSEADDWLDDWPDRRSNRPARRARITADGLNVDLPGFAGENPLLGQPGDRDAAVRILRSDLQAGERHDAAAIAELRAAAVHTSSSQLRQVIGTRALTIADRLIWTGPRRTAVPTETGLAAAKLATEMIPTSASAWQTLGPALNRAGYSEDAMAAYHQALALDPRNTRVHGNQGAALWARGRFEEALAAYDQALTFDPSDVTMLNNRGLVLVALRRNEEALDAYDQALAIDPDDAVTHENKGIALAITGHLDRALAELDTADGLDPAGCGEARTWAAAIYWHRRDAETARERFARVSGKVAGCTAFRAAEMEAIALCGLGQTDDAEQHLLSAIPHLTEGDRAGTPAIYDLLGNPVLPGIDRLRAIIDNP